jgi:hypothetical protein
MASQKVKLDLHLASEPLTKYVADERDEARLALRKEQRKTQYPLRGAFFTSTFSFLTSVVRACA